MADTSSPKSWMKRLFERKAHAQSDWGDQGTAFGLEMTFQPVSAFPEAGASAAAAPETHASKRAWWARNGS